MPTGMPTQLKVTSIERYHLCDDSPRNPNVIGCELTVSGNVNRDIATAALREAATRHPMVGARLNGRKRWLLDPKNVEQLGWQVVQSDGDEKADPERRYIDLAQRGPTRLILRIDGGTTHLSFRVHHAAIDGVGGLQFVHDWLLTYHRISNGSDKPKSRETNPEILKNRNDLRLLNRQFLSRLWIQPIAILGATKFLFRKVKSVCSGLPAPSNTSLPKPGDDFQILTATLPSEVVAQLKKQAAECKATVNELILRAVFLGIHSFRKHHKLHKKDEWLRLVIPMSIRDFADRRLPAANRATIVQLDRTDRDFADPPGMMWGLNYELGNIKRWNLEKTFLLVMRCMSCIPGLVPRSARKDICRATSVVTNLGAPFERTKLDRVDGKIRSGGLIVEDVGLVVPLRKQTPIGFAVMRYNEQQKFCMHFDPLQIEKNHAEEILDLVIEQLKRN